MPADLKAMPDTFKAVYVAPPIRSKPMAEALNETDDDICTSCADEDHCGGWCYMDAEGRVTCKCDCGATVRGDDWPS